MYTDGRRDECPAIGFRVRDRLIGDLVGAGFAVQGIQNWGFEVRGWAEPAVEEKPADLKPVLESGSDLEQMLERLADPPVDFSGNSEDGLRDKQELVVPFSVQEAAQTILAWGRQNPLPGLEG